MLSYRVRRSCPWFVVLLLAPPSALVTSVWVYKMLICGLGENEKFGVSNSTADILNCGHRGKLFNQTHQTFHMMTRPKKILLDILQIFSSIQVSKCFDAVGLFRMGISFKLEKTHLRLRARNLRKGEKLFFEKGFQFFIVGVDKAPISKFFCKVWNTSKWIRGSHSWKLLCDIKSLKFSSDWRVVWIPGYFQCDGFLQALTKHYYNTLCNSVNKFTSHCQILEPVFSKQWGNPQRTLSPLKINYSAF